MKGFPFRPRPTFCPTPLTAFIVAALWAPGLSAQTSQDAAMRITAVAQAVSPVITLRWPASEFSGDPITIRRMDKKGEELIEFYLSARATSFADKTAKPGEVYEYRLFQRLNDRIAAFYRSGVVSAAYDKPLIESPGRVCVLVDETVAVALTADLVQFASDLRDDGWMVSLQTQPRTAVVPWDNSAAAGITRRAECEAVKSTARQFYDQDPGSARALILVGHLPVPYSGAQAPDGHPDHYGAWPADLYYGDMDGGWTDSLVNNPSSNPSVQNLPGDGKFDQEYCPWPLELTVGRIDLADMPCMTLSETALLQQYLVRNHRYRHGLPPFAAVKRGTLVVDNFGFFGGEAFAAVGWNTGVAAFGASNVVTGNWFDTLGTTAFLTAYGNGGGGYQGAAGIGSSQTFATQPSKAVFNFLFGSYFGDWNTTDNFLRAPLGGIADSLGLVSCWPNRPDWNLSVLALNGTIGDTLREERRWLPVHQAVMGDPTLRFDYVQNPIAVRVSVQPDGVQLTWTAHPDGALGYHVFRSLDPNGPYTRVTGTAITAADPSGAVPAATQARDTEPVLGATSFYQVRAVFRRESASGSYLVLSSPVTSMVAVPAQALAVCSVVSRMVHGAAGAFDLPVVSGTVEPRVSDGVVHLVVRFNQPIVSGSVAVVGLAKLRSVALDGSTMTIMLNQVPASQWLELQLVDCVGATAPGFLGQRITLGVLAGDVDQSGVADRGDTSIVRESIGDKLILLNALHDLNFDGEITNADVKWASAVQGGAL